MKTTFKTLLGVAALGFTLTVTSPVARAADMPATMQFGQTLNNNLDKLFMLHAYQGNLGEVALGKLAMERAQDPGVKMVAQTIVKDHSTANRDLLSHFKAMNMTAPKNAGIANMALYDHMKTLYGSAFDKAYISAMVGGHEAAVVLYSHEADAGKNATIKQYATNKLPTILGHTSELYACAAKVKAPGVAMRPAPVKAAAMKAAKEQMKMMKGM